MGVGAPAGSRKRLHSFDNFRAIAILIIIIGHSYSGWDRDTFWEQALANAITGGTALFVFISGFFFHAVFQEKFEYRLFLRKKFLNVALPYLILSVSFIAASYIVTREIPFPWELATLDLGNGVKILVDILTGRHLTAYWYIPFVMLLFLASPVVIAFSNLDHTLQALALVALFVLSMLIHRPALNLNPVHALVYFFPFYLIGVVYSQNSAAANRALAKIPATLALAWLVIVLLMTSAGQIGNLHKWIPWDYTGIDWMVPQKLLLIGMLLALLLKYADYPSAVLGPIASMSFPLFFLHPWVLKFLSFTSMMDLIHGGFRGFLLLSTVVIAGSMLATALVRVVLGSRARYAIGA